MTSPNEARLQESLNILKEAVAQKLDASERRAKEYAEAGERFSAAGNYVEGQLEAYRDSARMIRVIMEQMDR